MSQLTRIVSLAAGLATALPAQTARPAYEAVVIKPSDPAARGTRSHGSTGQVSMTNLSLRDLIQRALAIKSNQLEGPGWMDTTRFDIAAKYPPDTDGPGRMRLLLTLLEDRFGLATHQVTREMEGYALVTLKRLKAQPTAEGSGTNSEGDGKVIAFKADGATMSDIAEYLSRRLNAAVVDRTGLTGYYTFEMRWAPQQDDAKRSSDIEPAPSVFDELQDKAGLKLQPAKVPVQVYIVDKLERTPRDN